MRRGGEYVSRRNLGFLAADRRGALRRATLVGVAELGNAQQLPKLGPVETYHGFTVHQSDRRRHVTEAFKF